MAKIENYSDLVTRWQGHQKYKNDKFEETDILEVIVQKLEMILFTNKGEILGQESNSLGADLEYLLWETTVATDVLKGEITQQINQYIPELNIIGYDLSVDVFEGKWRDILELNFTIRGQNVNFLFR